MKKLLTTASAIALLVVPALAQTTAPQTSPPATSPPAAEQQATPPAEAAAFAGQVSASDLLRKSVTNQANESVGDINDIRIDSDGKVAAVIVGVGGFLGLGEKNVALPYDQLSFKRDDDGNLLITVNATKESLQAAPEWKKPESTW